MRAEGGGGHDEDGEEGAGDGLHENVEARVGGGDDDTEIRREVCRGILGRDEGEERGRLSGEREGRDQDNRDADRVDDDVDGIMVVCAVLGSESVC